MLKSRGFIFSSKKYSPSTEVRVDCVLNIQMLVLIRLVVSANGNYNKEIHIYRNECLFCKYTEISMYYSSVKNFVTSRGLSSEHQYSSDGTECYYMDNMALEDILGFDFFVNAF